MTKRKRVVRISRKTVEAGVILASREDYTEITLSRLRSKLSETLNMVQYGKKCFLVTNYGKTVAQVLPVPEE
jgi:hypothetical protein